MIMEQQACQYVLDHGTSTVSVISDDTDVFVVVVQFYWKLNLKSKIFLEATYDNRTLIDIANTVVENMNIVPDLVQAHALPECDTVAHSIIYNSIS